MDLLYYTLTHARAQNCVFPTFLLCRAGKAVGNVHFVSQSQAGAADDGNARCHHAGSFHAQHSLKAMRRESIAGAKDCNFILWLFGTAGTHQACSLTKSTLHERPASDHSANITAVQRPNGHRAGYDVALQSCWCYHARASQSGRPATVGGSPRAAAGCLTKFVAS